MKNLSYDFSEQTALITGAGRGFGFFFAQELAQHGATVVLTDVDEAVGEQAAQSLLAQGLRADFIPMDVRDPTQVEQAAQHALNTYGRLDVWINNAGVAIHGPSATMPLEKWNLGIDIMLSGVFYGCQSAGRIMLAQERGSIINIASINGFVAQAGRAAYCAAKAGVIRMTEVLGAEWAAQNVRVNAIAPAVFLTDLAKTAMQDGSASMDVYINRSPSKRFGELPELGHTVLFLASDASSYITGQTLRVDNAWQADHYL